MFVVSVPILNLLSFSFAPFGITFGKDKLVSVVGFVGLFLLPDSAKRAALDSLKKATGKLKMDRSVHLGTDWKGYI
jgi:hypothetical protein